MVYTGGKKQELPPVRLPIKVAWVVSGAVRTLFLCAFGLRRNVLDVPGHAEFYVFGSVSHEGTDMELQGLAALKFLPETRGLVVDNEAACHHNKLNDHANITTSVMRRSQTGRWSHPRATSAIQSCKQRNLWYQFPKVGMGFKLALRWGVANRVSYDVAVRARSDVLFHAKIDIAALHLGYLSRDATIRAGGEYIAAEANGFCGGLTEKGATELCWTMQVTDGFQIGSADVMMDLWANISAMDGGYTCCEEVLRWNLAFRVGVRQAADSEQEPTLPLFKDFATEELPVLSAEDSVWFKADKLRPRSGCPTPSKEKKMPRHELCVRPDRRTNHDPWQRLGTHDTRTAKAAAAMAAAGATRVGNQLLAPYRAPLWRLKPGLGYGIKPEPTEKLKVTKLHGVAVAHVTKTDAVKTSFSGLVKCSEATNEVCQGGKEGNNRTTAQRSGGCPILHKPCRKCHFWITDEHGRACLPPNAVLPSVLKQSLRGRVRDPKGSRAIA